MGLCPGLQGPEMEQRSGLVYLRLLSPNISTLQIWARANGWHNAPSFVISITQYVPVHSMRKQSD